MCLSTSTIPSARLNEAPVGQTWAQGGSAQCWHITGIDRSAPVVLSRDGDLPHPLGLGERIAPGLPAVFGSAGVDACRCSSSEHLLASISMPQRLRGAGLGAGLLGHGDQGDARRKSEDGQPGDGLQQSASVYLFFSHGLQPSRLASGRPLQVVRKRGCFGRPGLRPAPLWRARSPSPGRDAWHSKQSIFTAA